MSKDTPSLLTKRFHLVRYFLFTSVGLFALAAGTLVFHEHRQGELLADLQREQSGFFGKVQQDFANRQQEAAKRDLLAIHESGNVNLTRLFANALWENDFAPYVARLQAVAVDHCRALADAAARKACGAEVGRRFMADPDFARLDAKVIGAMKKSTVFKIKVFDLRGITVYSSEHAQVGEDKAGNAGWKQAASGTPASELTHRDKFSAFEGVVENRDLISSYLPVFAPGGDRVVGVFEVYSDVTPFLAQIQKTGAAIRGAAAVNQQKVDEQAARGLDAAESMSFAGTAIVLGLLALLFGALYFIVRRADGIMRAQAAEREHAQQQLAQSEKLASLGQMVAGVAHQLNTPLAFSHSNVSLVLDQLQEIETPVRVATGLSEIARRSREDRVVINLAKARAQIERCHARPEDVGAMREMLRDVLHGIDQMSELVVHMRDFTRLDRNKVSDVDIAAALKSVVYIARSVIPTRIRVDEQYAADLAPVRCNASQLNQVFLNLIVNASQAIEGEGTITVSAQAGDDGVCVRVADTGGGIPAEVLPRIFEPYFTTKPEGVGTGLGLPIARDIVQEHGGSIEVATEIGRGTVFTVRVPSGVSLAAAA